MRRLKAVLLAMVAVTTHLLPSDPSTLSIETISNGSGFGLFSVPLQPTRLIATTMSKSVAICLKKLFILLSTPFVYSLCAM